MRAGPADDAAAARHGFVPERDVIQMRVALPLPTDIVARAPRWSPPGPSCSSATREAWLDVNNRAFAGHPEQGQWTRAQLEDRLAADWVDLNGFLMADDPDGGLIGSCWTKVHRDASPVLGEIYIISVDPDRHGQGWGKALTVAGLVWLAAQGVDRRHALHRRRQYGGRGALRVAGLLGQPRRPCLSPHPIDAAAGTVIGLSPQVVPSF